MSLTGLCSVCQGEKVASVGAKYFNDKNQKITCSCSALSVKSKNNKC